MSGNQRFSITPANSVIDPELTDSVYRTLAVIGLFGDRNGWCWPTQRTLAELRGISRQSISTHTKILIEKGYLNIFKRNDEKTNARKSNLMQIRFDTPPVKLKTLHPLSSPEVDIPCKPQDFTVNAPLNALGNPLGEAAPPPTGAPQESSNPPFVSKYSETKLHQRYGRFLKYRRDDDPDFKDPRLYHPALRIWRGAYKQDVTPKGNWRDRVINKVGDREGHLKVWRTSIEVWTGISENPSPMRVLSIFDNGGVLNDREDFMRQQKAASQDDTVQGINPLSAEYMAERMKGWKGLQASGILDQKPKFKEATT